MTPYTLVDAPSFLGLGLVFVLISFVPEGITRMKKWLLSLLAVGLLAVPLHAQWSYIKNVRLQVAGTAVNFDAAVDSSGTTCTSFACITQGNGHSAATSATCTNLSSAGAVIYTVDGSTATTTRGNEIQPGGTVVIQGGQQLLTASFIRSGSTSGDLRCVLAGQ